MAYGLSVACLLATALSGALASTCDTGTTDNDLSYMCSTMSIGTPACYSIDADVLSDNFACAQSDGVVETEISCEGIGKGTITCFTFASDGKTSGSCASCDTSMADGDSVSFLSAVAGDACIGQASCTVTISDTDANPKAKIIAYCGEHIASPEVCDASADDSTTLSPTPSTTGVDDSDDASGAALRSLGCAALAAVALAVAP